MYEINYNPFTFIKQNSNQWQIDNSCKVVWFVYVVNLSIIQKSRALLKVFQPFSKRL